MKPSILPIALAALLVLAHVPAHSCDSVAQSPGAYTNGWPHGALAQSQLELEEQADQRQRQMERVPEETVSDRIPTSEGPPTNDGMPTDEGPPTNEGP